MIPITAMLWIGVGFFAVLGMRRGWQKETLTFGILLSVVISILHLDGWFRHIILRFMNLSNIFALQAMILTMFFFMAHLLIRTATPQPANQLTGWRKRILAYLWGGIWGGLNGYLFITSLWYLLDINLYPFAPLVTAPSPESTSAVAFLNLPLLGLTAGPYEVLLLAQVITLSYTLIKL